MKESNLFGQIIAIVFALFLVSSASPVAARPDILPQLGIPNSEVEPVTVVQLAQPLTIGSTGEQVRELQTYLRTLGYFPASIAPTGFYGQITATAVRDFQVAKGLTVSESVNNSLWTRVYQSVYTPSTSCQADFNGDRSVDTRDVASYLNAWASGDDSADTDESGEVNADDFKSFMTIWNEGCTEESVDPCDTADFNNDGTTNTMDITAYLNAWTSRTSTADINGDGVIDSSDFTAFLDLWKQCR